MLCFSGNGYLNIKTSNFPIHQLRHQVDYYMVSSRILVMLHNCCVLTDFRALLLVSPGVRYFVSTISP